MPQAPALPRLRPELVWAPDAGSSWLVGGTTRYPKSVIDVGGLKRSLVFSSGDGNDKVGGWITKGRWRGFPIYMLTLEERATCPSACANWDRCYGNATPWAIRLRHGPDLESRIERDLGHLAWRHPHGFAVRLHQLGDFYSLDYVKLWERMLDRYRPLHVFGFTAWARSTPIGRRIARLTRSRWDRFAIRFSGTRSGPERALAIWREPEGPVVMEGTICPEQLGRTKTCGSCALCWSDSFRTRTVVFVGHGHHRGSRTQKHETR